MLLSNQVVSCSILPAPHLWTAAPLCAQADAPLAFGELSLTQLKHCGVFFLGEFSAGLVKGTGL